MERRTGLSPKDGSENLGFREAFVRIAPKEHEMHHRGQLMVAERMLGITPHLTRHMEERIAAMQSAQAGR